METIKSFKGLDVIKNKPDAIDQREKKKVASLMYKRRKLQKDINKVLKQNIIRYGDIERIGKLHGFEVIAS